MVDFVEFLASRVQRAAAAQRLTDAMARLDALNLPALSEDEIEDEVQATRPASVPRVVVSDPDDDHVLAATITGAADLIASGDKRDLLPLGSYLGIPIVTAREAMQRIEAGDLSV